MYEDWGSDWMDLTVKFSLSLGLYPQIADYFDYKS